MTRRLWCALVLLAGAVALCAWCAWHVRTVTDPLLQQLDGLEQQIGQDPAQALPAAETLQRDFLQTVTPFSFYISHDAVEVAAEALETAVLFLQRGDGDHALESLRLFRRRLYHIRDREQLYPKNLF